MCAKSSLKVILRENLHQNQQALSIKDVTLPAVPFRYKSAFPPARHVTFFPTLSIKVICILTHILISLLLETNAVPFYPPPPPLCWDNVICFPKQQDTLFKIKIKLKRDEQSGMSGSSRAAWWLKSTQRRREHGQLFL